MENLYKVIRSIAKLSQEQFADELGTTPQSINRWENGKTEPNKMAQKQLLRFCTEHQMELGELIVKGKEYTEPCDQLVLYHGSKKGIVGDIAPISLRRNRIRHGCSAQYLRRCLFLIHDIAQAGRTARYTLFP